MYPEALKSEDEGIFYLLPNFREFYLAGGTALALQLGHRVSVDFDLFCSGAINQDLLKKIETVFAGRKIEILVNNQDELTALIDGTKTSFINYPFPILYELIEFRNMKLLSILEIAATKAYTIGRRATYKDYIDLYFILAETQYKLENILEAAQKKFRENFDPRLFLEQLVYLEDVSDTQIQFLKTPVNKDSVQQWFENEVGKLDL